MKYLYNMNSSYSDFPFEASTFSTTLSYRVRALSYAAVDISRRVRDVKHTLPRVATRNWPVASAERAEHQQLTSYASNSSGAGRQGTVAIDVIAVSSAAENTTQEPLATISGINKSFPARAVGLGLLDIYFERVYNAPLLFDRAKLFESYLNDAIPPFLLRALFALSNIFLHSHGIVDAATPDELTVLQTYPQEEMHGPMPQVKKF
ncbi:hypothetical protein ACKAV7_011780 [Fusarium commune]